jgi:hypothetical protein
MTAEDALTRACRRPEDGLPEGWHVDSLRCASTGLAEADRSSDWIAIAIGPAGEERMVRAADPVAAIAALAAAAAR